MSYVSIIRKFKIVYLKSMHNVKNKMCDQIYEKLASTLTKFHEHLEDHNL